MRRSSLPSGRARVKALSARATLREARLINPIKKTRLHEEIADRIRQLILERTLPQGRALPSERVLARRFGVSRQLAEYRIKVTHQWSECKRRFGLTH